MLWGSSCGGTAPRRSEAFFLCHPTRTWCGSSTRGPGHAHAPEPRCHPLAISRSDERGRLRSAASAPPLTHGRTPRVNPAAKSRPQRRGMVIMASTRTDPRKKVRPEMAPAQWSTSAADLRVESNVASLRGIDQPGSDGTRERLRDAAQLVAIGSGSFVLRLIFVLPMLLLLLIVAFVAVVESVRPTDARRAAAQDLYDLAYGVGVAIVTGSAPTSARPQRPSDEVLHP